MIEKLTCGIDLAKRQDVTVVYLKLNEEGKQYAEELFMSGKSLDEVKKIILDHADKYITFDPGDLIT